MTRRQLKAGVFRGAQLGMLDRLLSRMRARAGHVLVLNLHRVSPAPNPFAPPLHPLHLEELLRFLQARCRVTTFDRLTEDARHRVAGRPLVILSFDDGFHDFLEYAMPALERARVAVNNNVIGACLETGRPPWQIELYDRLAAAPRSALRAIQLPGFAERLDGGEDSALRFGLALTNFLKRRPRHERAVLAAQLEPVFTQIEVRRPTRMLSGSQLREVAASHEVGNHSYSHESMALESADFFAEDFARCEAVLEGCLGRRSRTYAFPNGSWRPGHLAILRAAGMDRILLVEERPSSAERTIHPRITLHGDSGAELRLRALGARARFGRPIEALPR